jgi:exopolysaccharide production protein ExoQ
MSTMFICTDGTKSQELPRAESDKGKTYLFAAIVVFFTTLVFITPFSDSWRRSTVEQSADMSESEDDAVSHGTLSRQLALGSAGLASLAVIAWPGGRRMRLATPLLVLCTAYVIWCGVSCLWSDDFALSLRRWVAFLCELIAGIAISRRVTVRQFVWIVFACTLAWLGLGFLAELSQGTFRPWDESHRFMGLFHPNLMGVNAALLTLSSLYLATSAQRRNLLLFSAAALGVVFLWFTRSRTSLVAMFVSVAALWLFTSSISRKLFATLLVGAAAGGVMLLVGLGTLELSEESFTMGRQDNEMSSLTGRLPLWQELISDYVGQRLLTGYGYGAFWTSERIASITEWSPVHAHSTYIDLVLNVGLIGAGLCVAAIMWAFVLASQLEAQHANKGYGFIALIMAFALTSGATETYIGITWFFSFFGICAMCLLVHSDEQETRLLTPATESRRSQLDLNVRANQVAARENMQFVR